MGQFLFGAVYIIEQDYTDEEIKRDFLNMKSCGYNLVTLWPVANPWLAKNSHELIFDKTIEVLDICKSLGIKAILQLFGQNQAQEFMPDSALTKDMMVQDERGAYYNENCFWANINHPIVRDYIDLYFKEAILKLKDHPAIFGWDVFNEAHFRSDDRYTIREYQKWLEKKYQNIQNLNKIWYRRYDSFSQIWPLKRRSAYSIWSSVLPDVEYEKFRSENLTDICKFLYHTAKKYDDKHPIIIDGTSANIIAEDITLRNNDEFETAHVPDIYGSTFYPKSWGRNYSDAPWKLSMYFSIPSGAARKAKKRYIVDELQTHTQSLLTPGSEVTPDELYKWILMCIFTGADGIQLWRWRPFLHGYQATGRGLTRIDGVPNLRSDITKKITSMLYNHQDIFNELSISKPVVKIAISYSNRLFFDAFLKWKNSFWADDVEGWYKLFWNSGLTVEFTDLENLDEDDMNSKVIVLPSIISISNGVAKKLQEYVKRGGYLIADARLGAVNEYGIVPSEGIPGRILSELFGIKEIDVSSGGNFIVNNEVIPANFMYQILDVLPQTEIIGYMKNGLPAIVSNKFGNGTTLYFNSFMGVELKNKLYKSIENMIIKSIITRHKNIITAKKDIKVHISYSQTRDKNVALIVNFSNNKQEVILNNLPESCILLNLVTGESIFVEKEVHLEVPENTAYIYVWEEKNK